MLSGKHLVGVSNSVVKCRPSPGSGSGTAVMGCLKRDMMDSRRNLLCHMVDVSAAFVGADRICKADLGKLQEQNFSWKTVA